MEEVGLADKKDTLARDLSGGQRRKLCLAMALIGDPKILFLDEPTAGMDSSARRFGASSQLDWQQGFILLYGFVNCCTVFFKVKQSDMGLAR